MKSGIGSSYKYIKKGSKFKYVSLYVKKDGTKFWKTTTGNSGRHHNNERDAAIEVDKWLISKGKKPANILVEKKK